MLLVSIDSYDAQQLIGAVKSAIDTDNILLIYEGRTTNSSLFDQLTNAAISVANYSINNRDYYSNPITTTVLIVVGKSALSNLHKTNVDMLQHDCITFDIISKHTNDNWILSTTHSMAKLCISCNKLQTMIPIIDKRLDDNYPPGELFALVWYAQRIGFKLNEATK